MLMREDNSRLTKTKTFTSYLPVPSCLHAHLRGRTTEYIIIVIAEICQDWLMIWSTGNARLDSLEGWATQITGFKSTKKKKKSGASDCVTETRTARQTQMFTHGPSRAENSIYAHVRACVLHGVCVWFALYNCSCLLMALSQSGAYLTDLKANNHRQSRTWE